MDIVSLTNALGIPSDIAEDSDPRLEYIWGDEMFSDWGSQLVSINNSPIVLYKNESKLSGILHEACHAIFTNEDETRIFAYEWLVAKELTGSDRKNWENFFSISVITEDGDEGQSILNRNPNYAPNDWQAALFWLEDNGFSYNGKPVYGLGPSKTFSNGVHKNLYFQHHYKNKRNKL